jgi:hypothetical protein
VVARIAELQENIALVRRADHAGTVADLTRLADALVALNTPASLKEALVVRKQAHVMYASFGVDLQHDCADPVIPDAIWMERFSPNREDDAPRPRRRRRDGKSRRHFVSGTKFRRWRSGASATGETTMPPAGPIQTPPRAAHRNPITDRLFEGGCTAVFLILLAAAFRAAWPYLR